MERSLLDATQISGQLTDLIMPFMGALILLIMTLWFKDFASKIAKGIAFKMNGTFKEGDNVILDGEKALIVKIGMLQTVFGIHKVGGDLEGDYCWRYVPNERIHTLKIEKVIFENYIKGNDE